MIDVIRRMALSMALLLAAGSAAANFMASDLVYLPVVAHNTGVNESVWRSDVYLSNAESEVAIDVAILYIPSGLSSHSYLFNNRDGWLGGREEELFGKLDESLADIPPGGTVVLKDILGTHWPEDLGLGGLGSLVIFAYEAGTLDQETGRVYRNVVVNSRTYNEGTLLVEDPDNEGEYIEEPATYGQVMPGVPWYNLADAGAVTETQDFSVQLLNGGMSTEDYRYNVGFFNASDLLTKLTLKVQPFQANGEPFVNDGGQELALVVELPPMAHAQYSSLFGSVLGITEEVEVASVEVAILAFTAGGVDPVPVFTSYGSVVDNRSNDPTTILPSFKYPYDVDCMWTTEEDPAKSFAGEPLPTSRRIGKRPIDMAPRERR